MAKEKLTENEINNIIIYNFLFKNDNIKNCQEGFELEQLYEKIHEENINIKKNSFINKINEYVEYGDIIKNNGLYIIL